MLYVMLFGQYPFEAQTPGGPKLEPDRRIRTMMDRIVNMQVCACDAKRRRAAARDDCTASRQALPVPARRMRVRAALHVSTRARVMSFCTAPATHACRLATLLQWTIPGGIEISAECRDLLSRMLVRSPDDRITMQQIHGHPWFTANLPVEVRRVAACALPRACACCVCLPWRAVPCVRPTVARVARRRRSSSLGGAGSNAAAASLRQ